MTPEQRSAALERWRNDPFTVLLLEEAEQDRLAALEGLAAVEPDDDREIARLQRRVHFFDWLAGKIAQPDRTAGDYPD